MSPTMNNPLRTKLSKSQAANIGGLADTGRPDFGVSMRFRVRVSGHGSLGKWSSCSGLGLQVRLEEHVPGGQYDMVVRQPGELKYTPVTLERAVTKLDSSELNDWLQAVRAWTIGGGSAASSPFRTVSIELLSATDWTPIYTWTLLNAIPVQWTGPSLSAKGSDVATERLVLSYEDLQSAKGDGFAGRDPSAEHAKHEAKKDAMAKAGQGRLKLTVKSGVGGVAVGQSLQFDHNPQRMQLNVAHHVNRQNLHVNAADPTSVFESGGVGYTINDLRVEGERAVDTYTKTLTQWMARDEKKAGTGKDATIVRKATVLTMTLGTGTNAISRDVTLNSVNITYTRFTRSGDPCRATVTLNLGQHTEPQTSQNPTSGTPEPGRIHPMIAGQSLAAIAEETYGQPSAWRRIAENNGIDDPLRVRNGSRLMLPGVT